jgi:hypothetical protein
MYFALMALSGFLCVAPLARLVRMVSPVRTGLRARSAPLALPVRTVPLVSPVLKVTLVIRVCRVRRVTRVTLGQVLPSRVRPLPTRLMLLPMLVICGLLVILFRLALPPVLPALPSPVTVSSGIPRRGSTSAPFADQLAPKAPLVLTVMTELPVPMERRVTRARRVKLVPMVRTVLMASLRRCTGRKLMSRSVLPRVLSGFRLRN